MELVLLQKVSVPSESKLLDFITELKTLQKPSTIPKNSCIDNWEDSKYLSGKKREMDPGSSGYKDYVAGLMAGIAMVITGHPFDTVKVNSSTEIPICITELIYAIVI